MDDERAILRRFFGSPPRPKNCIKAEAMVDLVGQNRLSPVSPFDVWRDVEGQEHQ